MNQSPSRTLSPTPSYAGLSLRLFAGVIDLLVLAVPLAVFISFLSVGMKISTAFLELRPGEPPSQILKAFGHTFIYISLAFFLLMSWLYFAILESSRWRATARFFFGRLFMHIPVLGIYYFMIDCFSIP